MRRWAKCWGVLYHSLAMLNLEVSSICKTVHGTTREDTRRRLAEKYSAYRSNRKEGFHVCKGELKLWKRSRPLPVLYVNARTKMYGIDARVMVSRERGMECVVLAERRTCSVRDDQLRTGSRRSGIPLWRLRMYSDNEAPWIEVGINFASSQNG